MRLKTAFVLWITISATAQTLPSQPKADVIFLHGNIYTGVPATSVVQAIEHAEALAVLGDPIGR